MISASRVLMGQAAGLCSRIDCSRRHVLDERMIPPILASLLLVFKFEFFEILFDLLAVGHFPFHAGVEILVIFSCFVEFLGFLNFGDDRVGEFFLGSGS